MKFTIRTTVDQDYLTVKAGFNESLFRKLAPPFPPLALKRFDGSRKGDIVSMELNFFLFKQTWTSLITHDHTDAHQFYFIDEGTELPFFLSYWKHKHVMVNLPDGRTEIRDEIAYKGRPTWLSALLYPALYVQFWMRKPIYKRIFKLENA
ncbi:hypothetical protein A3SI_07059 [Nitritalea halalkaliphila LW7]|uniref:Ligand-binding SRPBCC domain-containing protein n=1 Tax=Nitritalea halalkaliphila LW7 TaxID=1189621 RepID=I5C5F8_9BACT|nr:hypothetical protein [Nitritalea halalkaliphila]EIM77060.1 hypothetical protein A3SI_07059 [Nitritalea halalkaliphila LW7]